MRRTAARCARRERVLAHPRGPGNPRSPHAKGWLRRALALGAGAAGWLAQAGCAADPPPPATPTTVEERARAQLAAEQVLALLAEQQLDQANELADRMIRQDPYAAATNLAFARARAARAVVEEDPRAYELAVQRANYACEAAPDDPEAWFVRGKLEYDRRHYSRALVDLAKVLELAPVHAEALTLTAFCHRVLRQPIAERTAWERLIAAHPDDARATYRLALILLEGGREDRPRGVELLERAVELDPGDDLPLHSLARLRADEGDLAGAEALLRRAVAAAAGRTVREADALFNLGACLQAQGRDAEAIEQYERCLNIDLENYRALGNLGFLLARQGDLDEGARRLRQALEQEPNRRLRARIEEVLRRIAAGEPLDEPPAQAVPAAEPDGAGAGGTAARGRRYPGAGAGP